MPAYDIMCEKCLTTFEVQESFANYGRIDVKCPKCGSVRVRRLISAPFIGGSRKSKSAKELRGCTPGSSCCG